MQFALQKARERIKLYEVPFQKEENAEKVVRAVVDTVLAHRQTGLNLKNAQTAGLAQEEATKIKTYVGLLGHKKFADKLKQLAWQIDKLNSNMHQAGIPEEERAEVIEAVCKHVSPAAGSYKKIFGHEAYPYNLPHARFGWLMGALKGEFEKRRPTAAELHKLIEKEAEYFSSPRNRSIEHHLRRLPGSFETGKRR